MLLRESILNWITENGTSLSFHDQRFYITVCPVFTAYISFLDSLPLTEGLKSFYYAAVFQEPLSDSFNSVSILLHINKIVFANADLFNVPLSQPIKTQTVGRILYNLVDLLFELYSLPA